MMERFDAFLRQLYMEHYERMFQLAYRMVGSIELARNPQQEPLKLTAML